MKAQKGLVPIRAGKASRDHSERQTAGHRNETDLLPPRAQEDGSRACLTPARREQPVAARFGNCVAIVRRSRRRFRVTESPNETSGLGERDTRNSARGLVFLARKLARLCFKKLEIKGVSSVGRRYCLSGRSRFGAVADPIGKYFPLRITLRSPELASRMAGIAACLLCQRVKQQTALEWIGGRN